MSPSHPPDPQLPGGIETPEAKWQTDDMPELAIPDHQGQIIAAVIADLARKQQRLSQLIDHYLAGDEPSVRDLARLLALHGQNASRLGRLLRDQQALSDPVTDELSQAIDFALDQLSAEWGVEL